MPDPQVFVRNSSYELIGEVADYKSLTISPRYNAVGAWSLELSAESAGTDMLDRAENPGGGIVVKRGDLTLLSGPARLHRWSRGQEDGEGTFTVSGPDDNCWLTARLVYPNPAQAPDDNTADYYRVASTDAEAIMRDLVTKNLGPTAPLVPRRVSGLTLGTDGNRGLVQASPKYRFETVLDALQQMSVLSRTGDDPLTDLGFRIVQVDTGIVFEVYESADLTETARFSFEFGNLLDAEYTTQAPSLTYAILGAGNLDDDAGNPLAAALYAYERLDGYYPIRAEGFIPVGTVDPAELDAQDQLDQQAQAAFETGSGRVGAAFTPIDIEQLKFGDDYSVGDFVTIELPYLTFSERVREVTLTYNADAGQQVSVSVGTADGAYSRRTPGIYRRLASLAQAVRRFQKK